MVTRGTGGTSGKAGQRAARKARLAAALRENLKRRKQQARQRAATRTEPVGEAAPQSDVQDAEVPGRAPDFRRNPGGE